MPFLKSLPYFHFRDAEVQYPDTAACFLLNAVHFQYVLLHTSAIPDTSAHFHPHLKAMTAAYSYHTSVPDFCVSSPPAIPDNIFWVHNKIHCSVPYAHCRSTRMRCVLYHLFSDIQIMPLMAAYWSDNTSLHFHTIYGSVLLYIYDASASSYCSASHHATGKLFRFHFS